MTRTVCSFGFNVFTTAASVNWSTRAQRSGRPAGYHRDGCCSSGALLGLMISGHLDNKATPLLLKTDKRKGNVLFGENAFEDV